MPALFMLSVHIVHCTTVVVVVALRLLLLQWLRCGTATHNCVMAESVRLSFESWPALISLWRSLLTHGTESISCNPCCLSPGVHAVRYSPQPVQRSFPAPSLLDAFVEPAQRQADDLNSGHVILQTSSNHAAERCTEPVPARPTRFQLHRSGPCAFSGERCSVCGQS